MQKFTLSTDSTCDLYHDFIVQNNIKFVPLTFTVEKNGKLEDHLDNFTEYRQYVDFYNELRAGGFSRTSMLNYGSHYEHFLRLAKEGAEDVVHFTISSGLSPTKDVAARAAADVRKDFPKFNVYVVDPLTATVGQGALVRQALEWRNAGRTAQETYDYVNEIKMHLQHFVIADDLKYLRRGGRVGAASATIGTMLNIKPVLTFDDAGKLVVIDKVKGTKKAIAFIKAKMEKEGPADPKHIFIVHTDNEPAARELEAYVVGRFGIQPQVTIMGPVIGSHLGPNAFALGYFTKSLRNAF